MAHSSEAGYASNDGDNSLSSGDYRNIAGVNSASPVRVPINGDSFDNDSPEYLLISKERWRIVRQIICSVEKFRPHHEWLMDHFHGYSYEEIGQRYSQPKHVVYYKITEMIQFLQQKIKGHAF